jgi:hypothetical protein
MGAIMRALLGIVAALGVATQVQAGALWQQKINDWSVFAYADEHSNAFTHCSAVGRYKSGIYLIFTINRNFDWSIAFANPKWRVKKGQRYDIRYWVDDGEVFYRTAVAYQSDGVSIQLEDSVPLFNAFRRGKRLTVRAETQDLNFLLTDTSKVLTYLHRCANAKGQKPSFDGQGSSPFEREAAISPSPAPVQRSVPATTTGSRGGDYRSEATIFAANLLSALGISGYRMLQPHETTAGFRGDAAWRTSKGSGAVMVLPRALPGAELSSIVIGAAAKACKSAFASGSLPEEDDGLMFRLFTKCGTGQNSSTAYYLVVYIGCGWFFVLV